MIRLTAEDLAEEIVIADKSGPDVSTTTLDISGLTLGEAQDEPEVPGGDG